MKHLTKLTKQTPALAQYPDWFCDAKVQLRDFMAQFGISCGLYGPKCNEGDCGVVE